MGHVNNTVYFRYMEQARISWFGELVPRDEAWKSTGIVIANATCNFKRPINYPGTVEVKLFVGPAGGSSIATFYELTVDENLCADGAATVVFIDMQSRSRPHSREDKSGTAMKKVYPDAAAALKGLLRNA